MKKAAAPSILCAVMLLTVAVVAEAQQPGRIPRIGYLVTGSLDSPETRSLLDAFRQGLREHGYVEGQNIVVEYRAADGKIEQLPGRVTELARLKLDLIVAGNTPAARAAQQATTTIPIVAPVMGDPVGDGLVASLARPGGNITGLTFLGPELVPKRLELLKEALPTISRVAALWHPGAFGERSTRDMLKETETAARTLAVQLRLVGARGPDEFDRAFSTMTRERAEALIVFPSPMLFNERRHVVDLAAKHRLPSMFGATEFVELGGLISYGASINDLVRRGANHVDKILKGAKPADLPVEQPMKFELAINLKTAKQIGLTIPQSVLYRADKVIQ
jgi:putative ABC transport system substrate-binding protein